MLTLGLLIDALKACPDQAKVLPKGFGRPMSYRAIFEEVAFEPAENVTVAEMLRHAESALGASFQGWKGGEYTMRAYTMVHIANEGDSQDHLGDYLLFYMFGEPGREKCPDCQEYYAKPFQRSHTKVQCLRVQLARAEAQESADRGTPPQGR